MKTVNWSVKLAICICLVQLFSCTKSIDTVTNDSVSLTTSDDLTFPVTNEFATCKMRRIYQDYGGATGGGRVTGLFTYNSAGNPISLTYDNNGTGNPNHRFVYDKQGRLREWHTTYAGGSITETRHGYAYDSNNMIIRDSTFHDESAAPIVFVSTLTYDSQGRIIKENIRNIVNPDPTNPIPTRNPTYTYDNRGNLAVAGWKSSSYDNKVSAFRAHPVFQFIFRNYSKNNAAPQAKYNSKGLPLSLNPGNDQFFNGSTTYLIVYDCQ